MDDLLKNLTADLYLESLSDVKLPVGCEFGGLFVGSGGQEVLTLRTSSPPTVTDGRLVHKHRDGSRNAILVVAIEGPKGVWLVGPNREGAMAGPLPGDQATRILQAGLDEPTPLAARLRFNHLLAAVEANEDLAGVTNAGLFATHYLATSARERFDWADCTASSAPLLPLRNSELIEGLGYQTSGLGSGALLLETTDGPPHAVAVLMTELEGFDASTNRFGASPVQYGLAKAYERRVPWLIVLRGAQIRLYPVRPDAGVGRRSQAETYLELDLSVIDNRSSGFLPLIFAAGSLDTEGSVEELLAGSVRYATALGERLRDRVYEHVVPSLAVAVANELDHLGHGEDLGYAYKVTLKILFRLLFQAYAEDQGLLPYNRNDRFTRNSLTIQANDFVERPDRTLDAESHAIWDDLLQVWGVIDTGNSDWDVPAYNGGLFGTDKDFNPDGWLIAEMRLNDAAVGSALKYLLTDETTDGGLGAVDFRSLSVREFGTIYEGLLESSLSRAETDLTLDKKNSYVPTDDPDLAVVHAGEIYHHNASGERKSTGSYFTKPFAVEHLLERSLDPTLDEHLAKVKKLLDDDKQSSAAEMFFDFRIADLAMGSGHFLIAAIDRMEIQMAAFLTVNSIPAIDQELDRLETAARNALGVNADDYDIEPSALLRRQIARRCIYGIDINEIAVELARVAVWIHTFVPGLPMSSLDHTLVCANSLTGIGTIDEAVDALEPQRKPGELSMLTLEIEQALEEAKQLLIDAANSSEATKAEVKEAAEAARAATEAAAPTRLLFDAAVAVRIGEIDSASGIVGELRKQAAKPHVQERISGLNPAHMPFLFPEVFLREQGGFDVLIGNPPWEKLHVEEHGWWALRFPGLRGLAAKARETRIKELKEENPGLVIEFEEEVKNVGAIREVIRKGPYPGIGAAHIDLFQAFSWRNWQLLREAGRFAIVLPRTALSGSGTAEWRRTVISEGTFEDVCFLINTGNWVFDEVDGRYSVALCVVSKGSGTHVRFAGPFQSKKELLTGREALTVASKEEFASWSQNCSFPQLASPVSGVCMQKMLESPSFSDADGFEFRPVQGDMNASSDRKLFDTDLTNDSLETRVLTGASFYLWNPDHGDPYGRTDTNRIETHLLTKAKNASGNSRSAFFNQKVKEVNDLPISRARIAFRGISRSNDSHTAIFCLLPPKVTFVHQAPYLYRRHGVESDEAFVLGILSSIPFDWYTRRWVETGLAFYILAAAPVPRPTSDHPLRRRVVELSGRLAAVDERFGEWAEAVGVPVGTLTDDNLEEKDAAIAELDALSALLYGLDWGDVTHIFETFHRGWDYTERLAKVRLYFDQWKGQA